MDDDLIADARWEATEPAREVLEHLHAALLSLPPFTLKDGTVARGTWSS